MRISLLALGLILVGCGDDGGGSGGDGGGGSAQTTSSSSTASAGGGGSGPVTEDFQAGGDRPVTVHVPPGYDPAVAAPLVILLHGYTASGVVQNAYFKLLAETGARGIVYAFPDGTTDVANNKFWNATDACCDFGNTGVDDAGYLLGLIDEISDKVTIDPKRVYFVGHSNGGFMSYRMACQASERVAAIASLAGANFDDPADCGASGPVSVLQIHGTLDDTVPYDGGTLGGAATIPSAHDSAAYWATLAGCAQTATPTATRLDLDSAVAGDETEVAEFAGCDPGFGVELWTMEASGHVPGVTDAFPARVLDFLLAHPKP